MTDTQEPKKPNFTSQVRGSLMIAFGLAAVAFLGTVVFATGGTQNAPQFVLALTIAGAVFVVTLVGCATLILVERPNDPGGVAHDPQLGQGTGINRSSAKLYAEAKARREAEAKRQEEAEQAHLAARIDAAHAAEKAQKDPS